MQTRQRHQHSLIAFFAIAFGWTWILSLPRVLASAGVIRLPDLASGILGTLAIFGPFLAAAILVFRQEGGTGLGAWWRKGWKLQFNRIWLTPVLLLLPVIGFVTIWLLSLLGQEIAWEYAPPLVMLVPIGLLMFILNALPEEFGWRGYALGHLQEKHSALKASLVLGLLWGIWHLPFHFISGTTQAVIPVWEFVLQTMVLATLYTWLFNNTNGSVVAAALFHTAGNLTGAYIPYWIDEVGRWANFAVLVVVAIVIVHIFKPSRLTQTG